MTADLCHGEPASFRGTVAVSQVSLVFPTSSLPQELAKKDFPTRMDVYAGMEHGFTLRPDLKGDSSDEVCFHDTR